MSRLLYGVVFLTFSIFSGCVTSQVTTNELGSLAPVNSLPADELSYYSDSFDAFNEDLWSQILWLSSAEKHAMNFKAGTAKIENGRLQLKNRELAFSKVRISSNFLLAGDFDFQVDLKYHATNVSNLNLEGVLWLNRVPEDPNHGINTVALLFVPSEVKYWILKAVNGKNKTNISKKLKSKLFDGKVRFVRKHEQLYCFVKEKTDPEWKKFYQMNFNSDNVAIGFNVRNYFDEKEVPRKIEFVTLDVDNFQISAAEGVIESDI